jgi:tetratricopeptide (TPR) repeat protein
VPEKGRLFREALTYDCADPHFLARIHNNLADACETMNRLDEAVREYQKATEIYPGLATPYGGLGDVYGKIGNLRKARSYYEKYWSLASYKTRDHLVDALSPVSAQRAIVPVPRAATGRAGSGRRSL